MDEKFCPECEAVIDADTIHDSIDYLDDNNPGAAIIVGECFNDDCGSIGEISLGYAS